MLNIYIFIRCVPSEQCDNQLDVRGYDYYGDESTPACADDLQKCCHESKIIEEEPNLCAAHSNIGYR